MSTNKIPILPNNILPNLRSKSSIAKRMVTALKQDANQNEVYEYLAKPTSNVRNVYFSLENNRNRNENENENSFFYDAPSEKTDSSMCQYFNPVEGEPSFLILDYFSRIKIGDIGGMTQFRADNDFKMQGYNTSNAIIYKNIEIPDERVQAKINFIPKPVLTSKNGEIKTTYVPSYILKHYLININQFSRYYNSGFRLDSIMDKDKAQKEEKNYSLDELKKTVSDMIKKLDNVKKENIQIVEDRNKVFALKRTFTELEKQIDDVEKFQTLRPEVFNMPVELATKAYNELKGKSDTPIGMLEIMDLPETADGERIEFARQGNVFNITSYDKNNEKSMCGQFEILKDVDGVPLKENNDGKILNQNDENYDDSQNKLCFNMQILTYHEGINQISCKFERIVNLDDKKQRHQMFIQTFDRYGKKVRNQEFTLPKYSENWLNGRLRKAAHLTSKHELKEMKANFEYDMINPEDIYD